MTRNDDQKYVAQVVYERGFATKREAERWLVEQDSKLTAEAEVDSKPVFGSPHHERPQ